MAPMTQPFVRFSQLSASLAVDRMEDEMIVTGCAGDIAQNVRAIVLKLRVD